MKFLHTGDWHLGKILRGRSRHDEHVAVLAEMIEIIKTEGVGLVIVAGDIFETATPSAEAQKLAWSTFLTMKAAGAEVVVISGNHDNAALFEAVRPVFDATGIVLSGAVRRPEDGGVIELTVQGVPVRIALLPWMSPRQAIRADQLMDLDEAQTGQAYSERVQRIISVLTANTGQPVAVEIVVVHAHVQGGVLGGGERDAQTVNEYGISANAFPASASYVALGHLHRSQRIPGPCPVWYAGSPIAVDFGEETDEKGVMLVDAEPGLPAQAEHRVLASARVLRTVTGTVAELEAHAGEWADNLLRVIVSEPGRSGLAETVRDMLPNALEVRVRTPETPGTPSAPEERHLRTPHESFAVYLTEQGLEDPRVLDLFSELLADELDTSSPIGPI